MKKKFVVWFKDVDKDDVASVGGKGANLGEMVQAGFPVPEGFIVTADAYRQFLVESGVSDVIRKELHGLDVSDSIALDKVSAAIVRTITRSSFPKEIAKEIIFAYDKLGVRPLHQTLVAVRSSATAEDLPGASFAGQQSTFLNVKGEAALIAKIREAWASLFTPRAIFYRATQKFDHFKVAIAVPVQRMVSSDASGILFTIDPVTNDKKKIVIEAIWGLGELIVQGSVTPDHYEVDKSTLAITQKTVHEQETKMVLKNGRNVMLPIAKTVSARQKITDGQIHALAVLGKKLERHYYFPQDVEWAIEGEKVSIVQTRPVTTVGTAIRPSTPAVPTGLLLLKGDPASPGIASGPVKILRTAKEIHRLVSGEILVAEQTNPDFVPAMRKAVAIVTARGGRTSHAAIVSRELGIPAVVGASEALSKLKDGIVITVNGSLGEVYRGSVYAGTKSAKSVPAVPSHVRIKTATKVYVNLAEPSRAREIAKRNVDGVGLLRAEFMIADIGTHPKQLIKEGKQSTFVHTLADHIEVFCSAFSPRPVVYRATDFKTNEYRNLKGGSHFEPEEPNPMLGFRGAARYVADPAVFELELAALQMVRNKRGHKNLHLMLPFVRTPKELLDVKKIIAGQGLSRSSTFHLWLMVEIPTNVIRLDEFLDVGIDGVSIGSNDLTMLILGTDRDNSEVAHDFSEMDPAVLWALERVIGICAKRGVTSSICGQAPSDYPDLVEKLVSWGVTSISVNPDAIDHVREVVSDAEKKIVRRKGG